MTLPTTESSATTPGKLEIPLRDSDEVIELDVSQLPEALEILDILRQESADLSVWINTAIEYYRSEREHEYLEIMETAKTDARVDYREADKDKMRLYDSLGAFYANLASKELDKQKKENWIQKANVEFTVGDRVIMHDLNHLLGRGHFHLLESVCDRDKLEQSDSEFNFVLGSQPDNIAALIGKGCIAFTKHNYRGALTVFRKALRTNPGTTADVRVGLGMCLLKLGQKDLARLAFVRALEINAKCLPALIAMALDYTNLKTIASVKCGVQLMSRAYVIDCNNPLVLHHLANHFFFKKEYNKCHQLARHAFLYSEHQGLRSESCYQLARVYHIQRDYDLAFQYYYQSVQYASSSFVLPQYGLGQMYLQRNDLENAAKCFQVVLKVEPDNYESLKILGSIYAQSDNSEKLSIARDCLKKVTAMKPEDVEAWIDLGGVLEGMDIAESLKCYLASIKLYDEAVKEPVPTEILNNVGSLYYRLRNFITAKQYFEETIRRASSEFLTSSTADENVTFGSIHVTACYNLARLHEACSQYDEAEVIYKNILKQHPGYVDCYLRIGCMARDKGNIYEASDWFKDALQLSNEHPDAWTLIGNLHLSKSEWQPAQKKFERILANPKTSHDTYSQIALANIWLQTLYLCGRDKAKELRHQDRALNIYKQVLRNDPKNIWAANGIGAVLAHKGYLIEARDIFGQVREATADFPDVWINIAHMYVEQQQFTAAIRMYENCMKKFHKNNSVDLLQFLARAQLKEGKLREAKMSLLRARRVVPFDHVVLYNLAFILQKVSVQTLRDDKSNLSMVLAAVQDLTQAHKYFQFLSSAEAIAENRTNSKYDLGTAVAEARQCHDLLSQAQYHVARARKADEDEQKQRKRKEEEVKAARMQQLQEQKRQEEEKKQREQETLRKREEFKELRKSATQFVVEPGPTVTELKPARKSANRKRTSGFGTDGTNESVCGEQPKSKRRRKRRDRDISHKRLTGLAQSRRPRRNKKSEEEWNVGNTNRRQTRTRGGREDPDRRGRIVSRELISTSDSSSEAGDLGSELKRIVEKTDSDSMTKMEIETGDNFSDNEGSKNKIEAEIVWSSDENVEQELKDGFHGFDLETIQRIRTSAAGSTKRSSGSEDEMQPSHRTSDGGVKRSKRGRGRTNVISSSDDEEAISVAPDQN